MNAGRVELLRGKDFLQRMEEEGYDTLQYISTSVSQ